MLLLRIDDLSECSVEWEESKQDHLELMRDSRTDFILTCYRCLLSETQDVRAVIQLGQLWKFDGDKLLLLQLSVVVEKINIDHLVEDIIGRVRI
jgi:hypothetical protein